MIVSASKKKARAADFRAADYARGRLPDETMQRLTGASRVTVARWRTGATPPPAAAVRLAELVYTGDLAPVFGRQWDGFRITRAGLLHMPGFKYGFSPGEIAQWHRLVIERDRFKEALERAQAAALMWRTLAMLKTLPAPDFATCEA